VIFIESGNGLDLAEIADAHLLFKPTGISADKQSFSIILVKKIFGNDKVDQFFTTLPTLKFG